MIDNNYDEVPERDSAKLLENVQRKYQGFIALRSACEYVVEWLGDPEIEADLNADPKYASALAKAREALALVS